MTNPFADRSSFEDETFEGLNLEGADLSGREFYRCVFRNSKLGQSSWLRSRLEDCTFEGCDLVRIVPKMLALRDVAFKSCRLMGVDFAEIAQYPIVSFEDCNLKYVSFVSVPLRKVSFKGCSLTEASFFEVDLTDATFEGCQLAGARFEACDLGRARFHGAQDLFLDPAKNRVKGAEIPLETAILLATSFGMRVLGFGKPKGDDSA